MHDLLLSPLMRGKVGFSGSRKAFVYRTVVAFIKRCLGFYPYGVSLCLSFRQPNPYAGEFSSYRKEYWLVGNFPVLFDIR